MGISGVQQSAALDMLKQALNVQQNAAAQMLTSMQQSGQSLKNDGDGDHGVEPGKGQHVNVLA